MDLEVAGYLFVNGLANDSVSIHVVIIVNIIMLFIR